MVGTGSATRRNVYADGRVAAYFYERKLVRKHEGGGSMKPGTGVSLIRDVKTSRIHFFMYTYTPVSPA